MRFCVSTDFEAMAPSQDECRHVHPGHSIGVMQTLSLSPAEPFEAFKPGETLPPRDLDLCAQQQIMTVSHFAARISPGSRRGQNILGP